jgi:hypothetical protein
MICGYGRHGKDSVADLMAAHLGLKSQCSSSLAARHVIAPNMSKLFSEEHIERVAKLDGRWLHPDIIEKNLYKSRHEGDGRKIWYDAICEYNKDDPTRLMRKLYDVADIYVGCRSLREFVAGQHECFQFSIWVDASKRVSPEIGTCDIKPEHCDVIIDNNGSVFELEAKVKRFCDFFNSYK